MFVWILVVLASLSSQALILQSYCFAADELNELVDGDKLPLPKRGICAHRGASGTHPENTLAALKEAVRLGAHMVEFDLALTKDSHLVLMHDETVDRTTDGQGLIKDFTLAQLRKLDAGSWKSPQFRNERIPTLAEALDALPLNIWINIHLKGSAELASKATRHIVNANRLHQAVLACGAVAAIVAREVEPTIMICNMDRRRSNEQYVDSTIDGQADFIQFLAMRPPEVEQIKHLKQHDIHINYCCTDDTEELQKLFSLGVEFVLVDDLETMLKAAERQEIAHLHPVYSE
ncbi:glycerophosphodiester phosphodiesterase [Bythopirellula goksoeyrii]|uniref:Glycerophosphoryl diester phosphodiesterase n=1 Tax=Bythopirellula goksoeyrii TaxID=1400387 RepID=A0A5B9Q8G7_9BACT|nr:glycerophosphodiester phosphodiesterase family protein [Bythopirellula goksoeyrii]QEG33196.1 Glycerophosphoryl diester phosphodiesterase [Bythopirellula goksoeyrii]